MAGKLKRDIVTDDSVGFNDEALNASGNDLNRIRRFRFYQHSGTGSSRLDFSLVIRHRIENYRLEEGKEYELPQYVINHIAQVKDVQYFSSAETGEERTIETPVYYCQMLD